MRFRFFTFFITLASSLLATPSFYEKLHQLPSSYVTPLFLDENSTLNNKEQFNQELYNYWMTSLLQQPFYLYDPTLDVDYVVRKINVNEQLTAQERALLEDTAYTQVALISAVGVLVVLPESISNWDLEELQKKSLGERWIEHVTTKPVWDVDDWGINYVGHPVFGAVYYVMARNDGMNIFESALFSTVMSTFFWEYGYEAFAEIPSIQDLIVTPLFGSFLGEGMHTLEGMLDENQGVIWGSKGLGSVSYFFLDPMGNIAGGLSEAFDLNVTLEFSTFDHYQDPSQFRYSNDQSYPVRFQDRDYGFMLTFY